MLKGNLSTRPFYNERLVTLAIGVVALVAVALTLFNARELIRLSTERRALVARIDHDRSEAGRIRANAATLQQAIDRGALNRLAESTREANDIIDQRMFSWTAFFSLIEKTMPMDVRLTMVSPRVERGVFKVAMTVIARELTDVETFVDALQGTGSFYDVAPTEQQMKEDGTFTAAIEGAYLPPKGATPASLTGQGSQSQTPPAPGGSAPPAGNPSVPRAPR